MGLSYVESDLVDDTTSSHVTRLPSSATSRQLHHAKGHDLPSRAPDGRAALRTIAGVQGGHRERRFIAITGLYALQQVASNYPFGAQLKNPVRLCLGRLSR